MILNTRIKLAISNKRVYESVVIAVHNLFMPVCLNIKKAHDYYVHSICVAVHGWLHQLINQLIFVHLLIHTHGVEPIEVI